jgi:hypothetical protein
MVNVFCTGPDYYQGSILPLKGKHFSHLGEMAIDSIGCNVLNIEVYEWWHFRC